MQYREKSQITEINLRAKIEHSKLIITKALNLFSKDEIYVTWTGGKDSTTMLWLYLEVCKKLGKTIPKVLFIDEGSVFEEILDMITKIEKLWKLDVVIVKNTDVSEKAIKLGDSICVADLNQRNQKELVRIGFNEEYFRFEPESFVGNHLMKTVAMKVFLEKYKVKALSTAIRWDEQESRIKEKFFSPRTNPDHIRVQPMLHFKERDIWDTIHSHKIPYCRLYSQGYRSLGAKDSTVKNSDIPAWEQDLENTHERIGRDKNKEEVMEQLRTLGYM
jgi:phosphoadenosine phosphosulfate reductase